MAEVTNGALVVAKKNILPIACMNDIAVMGDYVGRSQMFGAKNQAEGMMIVGICQQEGWSYADFMAYFDIIKGKLSKKPAAMLADFTQRGGTYTIVQRDGDGAVIEFKRGKQTYRSSCLWDDIKKEPLPYDVKESDAVAMLAAGQVPPLKPKYATPRSRMQMLWARCVSDGLRAFDPSCCKGIYTPEEVEDFAVVSPAPYHALSPMPSMPTPRPAAPAAPVSVEVCPAGALAGQRWDSMEVGILEQALNVQHPAFTEEVKRYIRTVIEAKRGGSTTASTSEPAQSVEAEVVQ